MIFSHYLSTENARGDHTLFPALYVSSFDYKDIFLFFLQATCKMYFLLICLFLPMINGIAMVKIHRSAVYRPVSSCTFLRNISIPSDGSIQSCIWECVHENDCQTSVYYDDENICSIFTESCQIDRIQSSGNVRTSVICYRTRTGEFCLITIRKMPLSVEHTNTCSSTATTAQMEEEKTAIPATVTSTEYGA